MIALKEQFAVAKAEVATQVQAAGGYGTAGLTQWIRDNVVTLVILILGVAVLWAARGGNISKGVTILAGTILGVCVLGLATGTTAADLGNWIVGLLKR